MFIVDKKKVFFFCFFLHLQVNVHLVTFIKLHLPGFLKTETTSTHHHVATNVLLVKHKISYYECKCCSLAVKLSCNFAWFKIKA